MRKLKILYINSKDFGGGGAMQNFQVAVGMRKRGHSVCFCSFPESKWKEILRCYDIPFIESEMKGQWDFRAMFRFMGIVKNSRYDVVHVQKGLEHTLILPAIYLFNVPAFVATRGVSFDLDWLNRHKFKLKRLDRIVAVSEAVKEILVNNRISPNKIVVIYGGTDLEKFNPEKANGAKIKNEWGVKPNEFLISYIAHLRKWKNGELLLKAINIVLKTLTNLKVAFVGRDDEGYKSVLENIAISMGIWERIIFPGYREDIPDILQASYLTVNCAYEGEGLTGAIRESLAMEKPVISTNIGGNSEIVIDGFTGYLFDPYNYQQLAEKMLDLLKNPEKAKLMGKNGRKLVEEKFSLQKQIEAYEKLYYDILQAKGVI